MESKELLEKKVKSYSVNQIVSKLQRGCPEDEKAICIAILKKRDQDTSKWEVANEKLGVFVNEDVELTEEEIKIIEKAEMAFEKEKPSINLKDILKDDVKVVEKKKKEKQSKVTEGKTGSHAESVELEGLKVGGTVNMADGSVGCVVKMFYSHKNAKEICKVTLQDGTFVHKRTNKLELKK